MTFIKAWRKHRRLSQDKLVAILRDRVEGFSKASLSRLENGLQPYSQPIMEALAWALDCTVHELLTRDPRRADPRQALIDIAKDATAEELEMLERIAGATIRKKTGT